MADDSAWRASFERALSAKTGLRAKLISKEVIENDVESVVNFQMEFEGHPDGVIQISETTSLDVMRAMKSSELVEDIATAVKCVTEFLG